MMLSAKSLASLLLVLFFSFPGCLGSREASADEPPFPILPGLEESVDFWKLVFTHYSSSELIFFDPLEPSNIYKVLDSVDNKRTRRLIRKERRKIISEHGLEGDEKRVRVQRGVKERFVSGLELSRKYLGQMQEIFREEGLPAELAYLPLIESSFEIRARSHAGAVGIWQFIRSTGRRYLRVNRSVDERRDPLESTRAAAQLLKENYAFFGNWPLAITAYNHGREGIMRAIAEVGSDNLVDIIRHYRSRSFGFASKNFYAEFLAAVEVAERAEEFFPDLEYHEPFPLEELELEQTVSVAALLKPTDVSRGEFLEWNPALSRRIGYIPQGYRVKFPPEKLQSLEAAYRGITDLPWIRHQVVSGETLSRIARRYRTSVRVIQEVNSLPGIHFIAVGQLLMIPKP